MGKNVSIDHCHCHSVAAAPPLTEWLARQLEARERTLSGQWRSLRLSVHLPLQPESACARNSDSAAEPTARGTPVAAAHRQSSASDEPTP